jgi:hypothetical protein
VGSLDQLVARSTSEAVDALAPLRHALADAIEKAGTPAKARAAIARVCKQFADDAAIGDALFVPGVLADLAGRLVVYDHEMPTAAAQRAPGLVHMAPSGDGAVPGAVVAEDPLLPFLDQPWTDAIEWFKNRGVVSQDELSRLLQARAAQSAEAQRLLLETVQTRVHEMLADAIEQDGTLPQFAAQLRAEADGLGITADDSAYIETVFRTNVASAYGVGRNDALNDPDVVDAFPFRQIRTVGDARVRDGEYGGEDHVQVHLKVYRADHPTLRYLTTPFGFNCRCVIVPLASWDGELLDELPPNVLHAGFGGLPAAA